VVQYLIAFLDAHRDEEGQGLVEYALIITLVALAVIVTLTALGGAVSTQFSAITGNL